MGTKKVETDKKVTNKILLYLANICVIPFLWIALSFIINSNLYSMAMLNIMLILTPVFQIYGMIKLTKIKKKYPNNEFARHACFFGRMFFILFLGIYVFFCIMFLDLFIH